MANRLLAYRVALEMEHRLRGRRRGSQPKLRPAEVAERLLHYLVRAQIANGEPGADLAEADDYAVATGAGISLRQTGELYEEIGLGLLVREVLDDLESRRLITIARKSVSGRYRGMRATELGARLVDLRPWWRRALGFFDAPSEVSRQA